MEARYEPFFAFRYRFLLAFLAGACPGVDGERSFSPRLLPSASAVLPYPDLMGAQVPAGAEYSLPTGAGGGACARIILGALVRPPFRLYLGDGRVLEIEADFEAASIGQIIHKNGVILVVYIFIL